MPTLKDILTKEYYEGKLNCEHLLKVIQLDPLRGWHIRLALKTTISQSDIREYLKRGLENCVEFWEKLVEKTEDKKLRKSYKTMADERYDMIRVLNKQGLDGYLRFYPHDTLDPLENL